jgi:multidrug efflux pump subunit AcrB
MWLVRVALKHPYTFIVMSMLIVIVGVLTIARMPKDIFPDIDIPVVSVIWNYTGMQPQDLEQRIVNTFERNLTTTVNDIEHVESQTLTGISVIKIFLQPGASVEAATAQITAISQTAIRQMPVGTVPPLIIRYSAANVPIMQLALSGDALSEQQLFDLGTNFIRADLATVQGAQLPWPYGGKQRQIMIDIDPQRLYSWGLSARDVNNVLGLQNVIVPSGTAKMGSIEYPVLFNGTPEAIAQLEEIPIKTTADGTTVFIRDVASVRDGNSPQTSMVHVGGKRSLLMSILKNGGASTLDVAQRVKQVLPQSLAKLTKDLHADTLFDQSVFVEAAVEGVVKEAAIAAGLTALMILLFLGSWRATLIVVISIPLSILVSIVLLSALGMTLNVMTLGGLSLAVGILVDDATVEIENIHRNMAMKKPIVRAIMDGAHEIAAPAFVSTLCICIVFVPVAFITGAAKSLFVPLALAVVFAMLTSYFLSRTVVPTLVHKLLAKEAEHSLHPEHDAHDQTGSFARFHRRFERGFNRLRDFYGSMLAWALTHRLRFISMFAVFALGSAFLLRIVGGDFFPTVDAGLIKLHVRGAPGTRIEQSEREMARVEEVIKSIIPEHEIASMIDVLGVPYSGINLSLSEGALISPADGQIMIALKPEHQPTADYVRKVREKLNQTFPDKTFFFLAPDISTQVLNFGLAAPIDVQVVGPLGSDQHFEVAQQIAEKVRQIPGAVDVHLAQVPKGPQLRVDVDRNMAARLGLTQRDVASDLLVSLSSSGQVAPNFWVDPRGVQYLVAVQTPQYRNDSIEALAQTPLSSLGGSQLLSNVGAVSRTAGPVNITHYNVARSYDVQCGVDGTDLGSVSLAVHKIVDELKKDLPRGVTVNVKGQAESMDTSFRGLAYGLIFAVLLVYLLMVVNFQSWLDPFIILMALPGALAGISWMLFLSHTTLSVPALMGAIMCIGVATANSILVVTFANEQRPFGFDSYHAALAAGMTRLRPVMMTALAMIIGMLPMSLGLGEGGEQNAPLGRAVIGGLLIATVSTLFFVPVMYSILRKSVAKHDPDVEAL